jgi:hypothetical protein
MVKQTRKHVIVDFSDIIHRPALLLKNISEIGCCLCSKIKKSTQMDPIYKPSP